MDKGKSADKDKGESKGAAADNKSESKWVNASGTLDIGHATFNYL